MEQGAIISWSGIGLGFLFLASLIFAWILLRIVFRRIDEARFMQAYYRIEFHIKTMEISEASFKEIKEMFNTLRCPDDECRYQKEALWVNFLTRFEPVHHFPSENYDPSQEIVLKARIESTLKEIDEQLNDLQERENGLIRSRKRSSELDDIHEEKQRLVWKYEVLEDILNASKAKVARGKNSKLKKAL